MRELVGGHKSEVAREQEMIIKPLADPIAILTNLANSLLVRRPQPSARLARIETAARRS